MVTMIIMATHVDARVEWSPPVAANDVTATVVSGFLLA